MQQFRDYEDTTGAIIRPGWIVNDVCMTIGRARTTITYSAGLSPQVALLAVTMMIEILELGWAGSRFLVRYPLPDDGAATKRAASRERRDYRIPERRARRRLIPDWMLERAAREAWEPWMLEEESGLDGESCRKREAEWREGRAGIIWIGECVSLDGPIPF